MKIYDWHIAPNPRRLHIFLAEKGIAVELVEVGQDDLTLAPWFKQKYPHAMVPMLELDDGTHIGEAMAIARYFEETNPEPPLMGTDAKDKAIVEMWEKRANEEGMLPASELFRNTHPKFADRGLPGAADAIMAIPELQNRGRARLARFFAKFDQQLAENTFVAGERVTIADATTLAAVDFAGWSDIKIPSECQNLRRWHDMMNQRPSSKA